jgi:tetratricopeptide (TPR) repeat protein
MTTLRAALDRALQLHQAGNFRQAEAIYRQVLQQWPGQPDALNLLGVMANQVGRPEVAIDLIGQALAKLPNEPDFHGNLAAAYEAVGRVADAVRHFRDAIRLNPRAVNYHVFLSEALQQQGCLDEALTHVRGALRLNPDSALAYNILGELAAHGACTLTEADIQHLQDLLSAGHQSAQDASLLYFTLAAHWERIGCHDVAFPCYRRANELKQQVYRQANETFDREKHRFLIDGLIATFTPQLVERLQGLGSDSQAPVFVVGMVRSGTTLVEQILASHPQVRGAGERKEIDQMATTLHKALLAAEPYPKCIERLDSATARRLADGYLHRLAQKAGSADRIIDKMPHNYLHLGLIAALFPRCRIIHCRRDPMDVCVSAYFQNFKWMPHCASLDDIAFYHQESARLMEHWRRVLPLPIHEIVYEDLVAEPEAVSRKLVAVCGLDWDERCLKFYRTERDVQTASKLQVRRPIYHSSVGRWKAFQSDLEPLRVALGIAKASSHHTDHTICPSKLELCHAG